MLTGLKTKSRIKTIAYWVTTSIIVLETTVGAQWDLSRNEFVSNVFHQLGYPLYLLTVIGIWKIPGAVVLVIPKFPRVKEWAYAGLFFIYTGAAASHLFVHQVGAAVGPFIFACITLASYFLRPPSRTLDTNKSNINGNITKAKKIIYWTCIVILEFILLSGGIGQIGHLWGTVEGTVNLLSYPIYFLTIIGTWKILGGIALLFPRFPRLQEWAYAGIFFEMTGAVASNAFSGLGGHHLILPLIFAGLAVTAWALRPPVRSLAMNKAAV